MQTDKAPMKISISKVIPAPKWKVIRMLTRVHDFPNFVPSVKEAVVLKKEGYKLTTRWRVQLDGVPVSWIEEDILQLNKNRITFRAIEGDLQEFRGEWLLSEHREGTKISVEIFVRVGIPAIKDFADAYIRKLVTMNFEAILSGLERRVISLRYADFRKGNREKVAGFGVIGHFYNFNHLERCFQMLNPGAKLPSREFLGQLFNITPAFKLYDVKEFKASSGALTSGCFIVATFIPDMVEKDMWAIFSKVVRACRVAEKYGVGVVTLGGFTSIVGERIGHEIAREVDVAVTTGNTFAATMAIDGALKAAKILEMPLASAKAAVIGGTGDIGSACARALTEMTKQVTITGRNKANLKRIRAELAKKRKAKIFATTNNQVAVSDADIVITAASSTQSILQIGWFKPGAIICDVGFPKNIPYTPTGRSDILIFSGGLAKSPQALSFPINTGLPSADTLYGCFSEAIILALEKRYEAFSQGRGNITLEKMEEIRQMGRKHGFTVSDFYWGDKLVDLAAISAVKEAVKIK